MKPLIQTSQPDHSPEVMPGRVLDFRAGKDITNPTDAGPNVPLKPYDYKVDDAPYDRENESPDSAHTVQEPTSDRTYIGALSSRHATPGELSLLAEPAEQNRVTGSIRKLGHMAALNPEYDLHAPVTELPNRPDNFKPLVVQAYEWQATKNQLKDRP